MGRILFTPRRATAPVVFPVKYGLLYNWYAATDARNITSSDTWVVPTTSQWATLITFAGGYPTALSVLKSISLLYWNAGYNGIDTYNFNVRGGGQKTTYGVYQNLKQGTSFWTSSLSAAPYTKKYSIRVDFGTDNTLTNGGTSARQVGCYLRLMRQATAPEQLLADGTACDNYTGNDGKLYRTVKIGSQIWLADNLAETKYRNGDLIPEVTDNTEWAALTTAGCCAYNNDITLI